MIHIGRYFWKQFLVNAALMALILIVGLWVIINQFDQFYESELADHLRSRAVTLQKTMHDDFDQKQFDRLNTLAREIGATDLKGVRITFILADGTVVGDSKADAKHMESHADRPEIRSALLDGYGKSTRWSHTVSKNLMYVAVRVGTSAEPLGVVRVAMTLEGIIDRTQSARRLFGVIAGVIILAAIVLALGIALLWSRRIERITQVADRLSRGNLSTPVTVSGRDEVALLGQSLDRMRRRLSRQVDTIEHHSRTMEALVSQLSEGVIVADARERIVMANKKALQLLGIDLAGDPSTIVGQPVEKIIHRHELLNALCVQHQQNQDSPVAENEKEIEIKIDTPSGTKVLLVRGSSLQLPADPAAQSSNKHHMQTGRVVILSDVTERTRMQQMKTDLAANASHELRTPISVIRASVETLQAINHKEEEQQVKQCIDVIDRHSIRMDALLIDLLNLSRIESASHHFKQETISVKKLVEELYHRYADNIQRNNLQWKAEIEDNVITLTTNRELLDMVLTNLLDNAIRFTDSGGTVGVKTYRDDQSTVICVFDTGCGIAPEDQHRVFERFYQVESSRSGPDRGTGLGLSIVRHAANAMGAEIQLESEIGKGTHVKVMIGPLGNI